MRDYNVLIFIFYLMTTHWSDIPHSNPDTDRAFNTLLDALEKAIPGIRENLRFVLNRCLANDSKDSEDSDDVVVALDLPEAELGGFRVLMKHAPQVIDALKGDLDQRKLTAFPNARLLGVRYGEDRWCDLTVHACGDLNNTIGRDTFSVSLRDEDISADTDIIKTVSGSRYVHPSRAGSAQPSFADALRADSGFFVELGAFADAIKNFRERIASKMS